MALLFRSLGLLASKDFWNNFAFQSFDYERWFQEHVVHIYGSFSFYVDVFIPQSFYPSQAPEFIHAFFVGVCVAHVFFCVFLLFVFTLLVPCCDVLNDFRINTMFGSSSHPVQSVPKTFWQTSPNNILEDFFLFD